MGPPVEAMRRIDGLLRAGDFRAAHDALESIVESNSGFVEAVRLLAGTKQALGDPVGAETLLRRALELDPNWTPTLGTLGELLLVCGRPEEAEPFLERAASGSPPYLRAAMLLARHYNARGQPELAVAVAAPLAKSGAVDAELATQHIAALAALGRHDEAVAHYRRLAAALPGNPGAAHALAIALGSASRHEEAGHIAHQVLRGGHRTATLCHTYAKSLLALREYERAEAALRECLRLEPRLVEAQNSLAQLVWMRTGNVAETTAVLDHALQTFANDDALWAAKAAILQGTGDARAACACLSERIARPQAPPALLLRAGLAALDFDPATAVALAERALRRLPGNASARTLLAAARLGIGDARGALAECEALLAGSPDDQYLIALQTSAYRLLGDERYAELYNYAQLVLPFELAPPPPWTDLSSFLTELRTSLDRLHDPNGHALLFQSLRHGTETTEDLSRSADPVIRALFSAFTAPIREYVERMGPGSDPLRRRRTTRWRYNGGWSVRLHPSGFHTNHVHPRGWISSACYIELPTAMSEPSDDARMPSPREGWLTFGEPGIATTPPLRSEYSVQPRAGMLVLFPSYFWHGTVPFQGNQGRLTVAFDVVPG